MRTVLLNQFSDAEWLKAHAFEALAECAHRLDLDESSGREMLIRILEHRDRFPEYGTLVDDLVQKAGLYPYLPPKAKLTTGDLIALEYHVPAGLDGIVLHSLQGKVYRALMDGTNVILSAPTSFGKSLLIDAMIASGRFSCVVVIVPTIALIDETRRRLSVRFGRDFKIITHPSQKSSDKNVYVLTQERFVEFEEALSPDFFVLDEFYKLSPSRGDERTFVLNHAFYRLIKSGAQFLLIGPNVQNITIDNRHLDFRYFQTDFSTVATEIKLFPEGNAEDNAVSICRELHEPTLIFCKSANSAYKLADALRENGITAPNDDVLAFSCWLRENYHKDWVLADLLEHGYAVHHGSLPRSVSYHLLRKFNEGAIRFLFCTSTIIEGVNTAAKNIVIYDNKIATKKFDLFTFNNIKGRAGRMLKHFVGHVFVLHYEPQQELPLVDMPSITQPDDTPESLLVQLDERDLSAHSLEKLRYLHAQDLLPLEIIKQNSGIQPESQLSLAEELLNNPSGYHAQLAWRGFPSKPQLTAVCTMIFEHLMGGRGQDGVFSANQLAFKISRFAAVKDMRKLIAAELEGNEHIDSPSAAVEETLMFLRRWCEFHFPRYISACDRIQRSVFERAGLAPGDYSVFGTAVKQLFMPLAATVLEEYGLPYQVTLKIEKRYPLGDDVDAVLAALPKVDVAEIGLSEFEQDLLKDTLSNL